MRGKKDIEQVKEHLSIWHELKLQKPTMEDALLPRPDGTPFPKEEIPIAFFVWLNHKIAARVDDLRQVYEYDVVSCAPYDPVRGMAYLTDSNNPNVLLDPETRKPVDSSNLCLPKGTTSKQRSLDNIKAGFAFFDYCAAITCYRRMLDAAICARFDGDEWVDGLRKGFEEFHKKDEPQIAILFVVLMNRELGGWWLASWVGANTREGLSPRLDSALASEHRGPSGHVAFIASLIEELLPLIPETLHTWLNDEGFKSLEKIRSSMQKSITNELSFMGNHVIGEKPAVMDSPDWKALASIASDNDVESRVLTKLDDEERLKTLEGQLTPTQFRRIMLYGKGYTHKEIAEYEGNGISERAISDSVSQAKIKIEKHFQK